LDTSHPKTLEHGVTATLVVDVDDGEHFIAIISRIISSNSKPNVDLLYRRVYFSCNGKILNWIQRA